MILLSKSMLNSEVLFIPQEKYFCPLELDICLSDNLPLNVFALSVEGVAAALKGACNVE